MSHGRERPCSMACCGHYAMQFTKCQTIAMSPNASSNEPNNDTNIPEHSKFEASALPFRIQIALGWNWLSRVEMQQGMVGGRVGFLVAGLWEGVPGTILNDFSTSYFLHVAVQCRFTSLLLLGRFCFFFGSWEVSHITRRTRRRSLRSRRSCRTRRRIIIMICSRSSCSSSSRRRR